MLTAIHLKSASSPGQPKLGLSLEPSVTIFVGPNNSGKSLLLREIAAFCKSGSAGPHTRILDHLDCSAVDDATAGADLARITRKPDVNETFAPDHVPVLLAGARAQVHRPTYVAARKDPHSLLQQFAQFYLGPLTLSLDGTTRIGLLNPHARGDLKYPTQPLSRIFTDNPKRAQWSQVVYAAFGLYHGIDATVGDQLSVRFGKSPPPRERTLEQDIIDWMREADPIEGVSDGVKAFSGILLQIYAGDPKIIIIDEPEAFLHPALARTLGRELATAARNEQKFVFVSTHSSDFLMGAIQSGAIINIVRLTWSNDIATARLLPSAELVTLMNDPMLRSVGVLSGLFFQNVVVTEADTDRAFYNEINERLSAAQDPRAIRHALFLNADNHQTIPAIVAPLRKLGIPAVGIADLDVIKRGGGEWTRQLEASGMPTAQQPATHALRDAVLKALVAAAPSGTPKPDDYFKTAGGVGILSKSDRQAADNFCDELARYGLFLVRVGEVEAWLKHLGVPQKSNGWRAKIFEAMGNDPSKPTYVHPANGDVWDFIRLINAWLSDPQRRGIPE
jgi:energy-coupling factor transporter ATP-binding protein EcfA2